MVKEIDYAMVRNAEIIKAEVATVHDLHCKVLKIDYEGKTYQFNMEKLVLLLLQLELLEEVK